jgi:ABC-type phosphate/phosphonate transport system substrate-binding protein
MHCIANARMYSATPSVKADWRQLLSWVLERARLPWEVIDYDAPAPLSALWARDDLGVAFMCGLPFSRHEQATLIAAPVPSPARYGGRPVYFTDIVVHMDSRFQSLPDTFGGVVGYTVADSLSGAIALRHHLEQFRTGERRRLYRESVGNLIHARGVIDALVAGRIDVGPLDSYYHDLLRLHDPDLASQVRVIATTSPLPIPPLVATAALAPDELARVREALGAAALSPQLAPVMERLLLSRFVVADASDYEPLAALAAGSTIPMEEL